MILLKFLGLVLLLIVAVILVGCGLIALVTWLSEQITGDEDEDAKATKDIEDWRDGK